MLLPSPSTWRAQLEPSIRHLGWFGFLLAPIIGPQGYGMFIFPLSGIAIIEAVLAETIAAVLSELPALDERHLSTALVSAVGAGGVISLTVFFSAGEVGALLGYPALADFLRSLSLLPLLGGLGAVPTAVLRRRGKHGPFVATAIAGVVAGGGIALALARVGAGPWSLVAQVVVQHFVECAVLWGVAGQCTGLDWSRRHFMVLISALDLRAFAAIWPMIARQVPNLIVGLVLGPVAAGLYMLATRPVEAMADILITAPRPTRRALLNNWADVVAAGVCRTALPTVFASTLLAIALPPLVDLRWWGAVAPAQILLLGLLPAAVLAVRETAIGRWNEAHWQAVQIPGALAVVVLAAPHGLTAIAEATLGYMSIAAMVSVRPIRRELGAFWGRTLALAARPARGAVAAGLGLYWLAEPVSLALAPILALCLLGASGRLLYLLAGGEPPGAPSPDFTWRRWFRPIRAA